MAALYGWLETQLRAFPRKSTMAEAIRYALTRWPALTRYLDDGRLEIDNNTAERAIRAIAIGRKNWLFAGSDDGGRTAATFYTLIETASRCLMQLYRYRTHRAQTSGRPGAGHYRCQQHRRRGGESGGVAAAGEAGAGNGLFAAEMRRHIEGLWYPWPEQTGPAFWSRDAPFCRKPHKMYIL